MSDESRLPVTHEQKESLFQIILSPIVWAIHFMACYLTAAIWCAKMAESTDSFITVRLAIATYTAIALPCIAAIGYSAFRRHRYRGGEPPHDAPTSVDRHRFLGLAGVLLSSLSAVAVIYAALAAVFIGSCR